MPPATPDKIPEAEPIIATPVLSLIQVPPPKRSVKGYDKPAQIFVVPFIADGVGLIVAVVVTKHPAPAVKLMVDVPAIRPVSVPVGVMPEFALLVLQAPAPASLKVVDDPTQTTGVPRMAVGIAFTVTIVLDVHPPTV